MSDPMRNRDEDVEELLAVCGSEVRSRTNDEDLRAMCRYLLNVGVPVERLRAAVAAGDLRTALAEYRLRDDGQHYDVEAVAARTRLPAAAVVAVLGALGLAVPAPGQAALSASDMQAVQLIARAQSFFGDEAALRFGRVMKLAVSRVADAAVSMFGINFEDPLLRRGGTNAELMKAADTAITSLSMVSELFGALFQRQALEAVGRMAIAHGADTSYETVTVSIGFADMVGSTAWARDRTPRELADAFGEFERLAHAALDGGSRLVKTIGDEVMFMAPTPEQACRSALNLVETVAREARIPELRIGLAYGRVVSIDGDLYGPVVNLASRLVHQAEPGQALADPALAEAARGGDLAFTALEPRLLAGFDQPIAPHLVQETQPDTRSDSERTGAAQQPGLFSRNALRDTPA